MLLTLFIFLASGVQFANLPLVFRVGIEQKLAGTRLPRAGRLFPGLQDMLYHYKNRPVGTLSCDVPYLGPTVLRLCTRL